MKNLYAYIIPSLIGLTLFACIGIFRIKRRNISLQCFALLSLAILFALGINIKTINSEVGWLNIVFFVFPILFAGLLFIPNMLAKRSEKGAMVDTALSALIAIGMAITLIAFFAQKDASTPLKFSFIHFITFAAVTSLLVYDLIFARVKTTRKSSLAFGSGSIVTSLGVAAIVVCLVFMGFASPVALNGSQQHNNGNSGGNGGVTAPIPDGGNGGGTDPIPGGGDGGVTDPIPDVGDGGLTDRPGQKPGDRDWGINFTDIFVETQTQNEQGGKVAGWLGFYPGNSNDWGLYLKGDSLDKSDDTLLKGNSDEWGFIYPDFSSENIEGVIKIPSSQPYWQLKGQELKYWGIGSDQNMIDGLGAMIYVAKVGYLLPGDWAIYLPNGGVYDPWNKEYFINEVVVPEGPVVSEKQKESKLDLTKAIPVFERIGLPIAYLSVFLLFAAFFTFLMTSAGDFIARGAAFVISGIFGAIGIGGFITLLVLGLYPLVAMLPLSIAVGFVPLCCKKSKDKTQSEEDETPKTKLMFKRTTVSGCSYPAKPKVKKSEKKRINVMENQMRYYSKFTD